MGIIEIIIIAIVEAMDCFAVAIATGLSKSDIPYSRAMLQSVSFGVFQGGMTLLGYFLGNFAEQWFESIGTPIACAILCILGGRMIWGAVRGGDEEAAKTSTRNLSIANILLMSVATSIDAFAVGISFAFINADMVTATSAIAIASFVMGVIGYEIGRRAAKQFKTKIPEIIAGIILIGIGIKMFF
ncbi:MULTISPECIES: manganese efflux pump [unclassified Fibrobacter]|uniref:manganese efflux pump MntP n=1 Tax=unclassified Fibrobacter TaxID=2634177 RepID=UPI000D6C3433|nr:MULTISPECIES: manganese efflux pump [unclassified Fibrobacter]PWJ68500.1 putative Mn2+ efflux pump MntP [Fibrobacter sp. UWR4]PZW72108.1 putative Mn2+ efflux pump MntP [Fibrobacter sp. UWR1]